LFELQQLPDTLADNIRGQAVLFKSVEPTLYL